jgi:TolB-like protein
MNKNHRRTVSRLCCWAALLSSVAVAGCNLNGLDQQSAQVARILGKRLKGREVAVFEFPDEEGCITRMGRHVSEQLTVHLSQALRRRRGVVVERRELAQVARSADIDLTSGDPSVIARSFGRFVGADVVVLGSATEAGKNIYISVRAVNVAGGEIIVAEDIRLPADVPNRKMILSRPAGPSLLSATGAQCAAREAPSTLQMIFN